MHRLPGYPRTTSVGRLGVGIRFAKMALKTMPAMEFNEEVSYVKGKGRTELDVDQVT